jgi:hypothetical protein
LRYPCEILKIIIMKKLSLLIAGIVTFSAMSFAQAPAKAKPAQEPVKATTAREAKGEKVPAPATQPVKTTAASPSNGTAQPAVTAQPKRKMMKRQAVQKTETKAVPVGTTRVK